MKTLLAALPLALGIVASAGAQGTDDEAAVAAALVEWVQAFNARDAARIAALYAPDAVLWGTSSRTIRATPEAVLAYFTDSVTKRPRLRTAVVDQHIRIFGDMAINSGAYTSTEPREEGDLVSPSRFTFVYRREGGRWWIVDHHSSRMPAQ